MSASREKARLNVQRSEEARVAGKVPGSGKAALERKLDAGPLVSVIIPTHNRAEMLLRAIESVQHQTYSNLEIIVVDDASSDHTAELLRNVTDPRIRWVQHVVNRGGSAARNTGITSANGQYIAFLDDDDEWEPRKTEEQLAVLREYDAVLCTSVTGASGSEQSELVSPITPDDLRRGRNTTGGTGALMARAEVLKSVMFDESLPRYQDWDLFIRISEKHRIGYLNRGFVRYNTGDHRRITNRIQNMRAEEMERQLRMVHKHRLFFGAKWFRRHMCKALMFGVKHRQDRVAHIAYVASRYGVVNVAWALLRRGLQKIGK